MRKNPASRSGIFNPRILLGLFLCAVGALLGIFSFNSFAATPAEGTLTPTNHTLTYTDTLVTNTSGSLLGEPVCAGPGTCSDFKVTVNAQSVAATKQILIQGSWTPPQNDFDIFITNAGGTVIASNLQTANPSTIILPIPADGTVYHIIIEASIGAGNLEGLVKLIDIPAPVNQGSGTPPRYINYVGPSGGADRSGEPSIGVDWNPNVALLKHDLVNTGGVAFFTANLNQYRVDFDDCSSPALNPWTDATFITESIDTLDPIGFTDHYTTAPLGTSYPPPLTPGRTFQAQLAGGHSITAFTDDDGATHTPSQGGGPPAGPDHQTLGGGPFHAPLLTPPPPAYPNAIYYCSQSLAEAECSRSDDGGVTFGPGVPIFNPTQCLGGIHGHVKVSPQGTVYLPNSSCGTTAPVGTNGVTVSKDNGITWNSFTVPGSTGGQDPSLGIGQNSVGKPAGQVPNTIYFGWISADGHPHVAHSGDEGATWQDDIDVGSILGVKNAVFPVVVAGDDNRAAYGFLGTTTAGPIGDPGFEGVWHLYIAHTYDGGKTWILVDVTPFDPVQKGSICLLGIGCSGGRNLLDFNDIGVDAQGRALLAYADGCVNCNNTFTQQSIQAKGTIARQSGGRPLFAFFDPPLDPAPPAAPQVVSAVRASGIVTVTWLEPDNGGSPITGYKVYRGTASGTETFLADVPATSTKYFDNDAPSTSNWFYRVTAVNAVAEGPFCREVNVNDPAAATTACLPPYIQVQGAAVATNDPTGQFSIEHVNFGEPFINCSTKQLTAVMKVNTMDPTDTGTATPPPVSTWVVHFRIPGSANSTGQPQTLFIHYDNTTLPEGEFVYGWVDPATAGDCGQLYLPGDPANPASGTVAADGTITMNLNLSSGVNFGTCDATAGSDMTVAPAQWTPGMQLTNIQGTTYQRAGGIINGVKLTKAQTTGNGTYTTIGNVQGCNTTPPLAVLSANPLSGPSPLTVNFDGSGSFESFGACGTINSYTMNFGDGSPAVTQASPLFSHTYTDLGFYPARLTVQDTLGLQSVNLAQVVITVEATVQWSSASYSVNENGGNVVLTATRSGNSPNDITVHYQTSDGTAQAGLDYTAKSGDLTFPSGGPSSQTISIPITDDSAIDGDEAFNVTLSAVSGGAVGTPSAATVTIVDNDETTPTPTPTVTPSATPTATASVTPSATPTATASVTPSATPTATASVTPSATPTATASVTPSATPTASATPSATPTATASVTPSATPTATATVTPSATPTPTTTPGPTGSPTPTASPTPSGSPSPTPSITPTPTPTATPTPTPAQLLNISTRLRVQTDDKVLIGGMIVTGNDPKKVLLRAIGPSMRSGGVLVPGRMADPILELHDGNGALLTSNDDWKDSPQRAEIENSGLAPNDDRESAILRTVAPGPYTAILRGKDNSTGIALVEAYDLETAADSIVANISSRGFVETDDNVIIGGFILGNHSGSAKVLIRAIAPSLKNQLPDAMDDPVLELHDRNGATIATNDNWKDNQREEIEATGIPPSNDFESAMVRIVAPAAYTAIVRGKNNTVGVAVVEIYNIR